jgi:Na+-driven multidrug efflux pump
MPLGSGRSASIKVGQLLGKGINNTPSSQTRALVDPVVTGQPETAQQAALLAMQITWLQALAIVTLLYTNIDMFVGFFTSDAEVMALVKSCIFFVCLYMLVDHSMATLQGIVAGCGKQAVGAVLMLVGGWVITLPLAWYLAFYTTLQLSGIYVAIAGGYFLVALAFGGCIVFLFDWSALSQAARVAATIHSDAKFEGP